MLIILEIWHNFYVTSLQVFTKRKQTLEGYIKIRPRKVTANLYLACKNIQFKTIIQAYSEPCVTLAYSETWYIQNSGKFKTRGIFKTLVFPKLWHSQNQGHIQNPGIFRTLGYSESKEVLALHLEIHVYWDMYLWIVVKDIR